MIDHRLAELARNKARLAVEYRRMVAVTNGHLADQVSAIRGVEGISDKARKTRLTQAHNLHCAALERLSTRTLRALTEIVNEAAALEQAKQAAAS